jgi:hypothetical protein
MEGANEAARRAVNGVLDSAGFDGARCELWPLYEPEILATWRLYDAERFKAGLPWDATLTGVAARFLTGSELLDKIRPLMETAAPYLRPVVEALNPSERTIEAATASNAADAPFERLLVEVPALEDQLAGLSSQPPGAGEILSPGGFVERMIWYREMISDALTSAVPKWEPQRHLYALVDDFVARSGKGLRPALCIATARAWRARRRRAVCRGGPGNAAQRISGSRRHRGRKRYPARRRDHASARRRSHRHQRRRRHECARHAALPHGRSAARPSMRSADSGRSRPSHRRDPRRAGDGARLDARQRLNARAGRLSQARLEEDGLVQFHPMRIGALVANGQDPNLCRFDAFGFLVGLAFQITDDVLNLNESLERYGKEIDGDLWEANGRFS